MLYPVIHIKTMKSMPELDSCRALAIMNCDHLFVIGKRRVDEERGCCILLFVTRFGGEAVNESFWRLKNLVKQGLRSTRSFFTFFKLIDQEGFPLVGKAEDRWDNGGRLIDNFRSEKH